MCLRDVNFTDFSALVRTRSIKVAERDKTQSIGMTALSSDNASTTLF